MKNNKGMTLVELLVVVAIIGILSVAATTAYIGTIKKSARSEAYSNLESLRLLEEQFFAENACYQTLVAGVCQTALSTITGASNIQALLPGFRPGGNPTQLPDFGLSFQYEIRQNTRITNTNGNTVASPPTIAAMPNCFTAVAIGRANTRVTNDFFAIDCNNNRNF